MAIFRKRKDQMAASQEEPKLLNNMFVMDQNVRFDTFRPRALSVQTTTHQRVDL